MNLTEVLLAVIITMAVIAGSYFLYTTVTEKNAMTQTMENLSLLRANIEDIYDGDYSDSTFGNYETMNKMGILPQYFVTNASNEEGGAKSVQMRSHWGPISLAVDGSDESKYTIKLESLSGDACMHFARFQYKSWYKIEVGETEVWNRATDTKAAINAVATACTGDGEKSVTFTAP